jgi:hypothetical protein
MTYLLHPTRPDLVGVDRVVALPAKHFVQEDCPIELADLIAAQVRTLS